MPHVVLPNYPRALPKPKLETTNEKTGSSAGATLTMEDPGDEPGAEMAKGAQVWSTYVKETDRWDKEMVDGRNNSLDVLLIFAALFSAVSTAFIAQSLGDLKPDPADLSAKTLLAISLKLDIIASGQRNISSLNWKPDPDNFSPAYSAVIVNILWFLSLSLSIAVSLIAMLAKDWCYKFMSGRSGQAYDQARRRQERWNGIDRWKMEEMLSYLPGLMHLALLLFAIGLCTYLWNISVSVAAPVTIVIWMATCVYIFATFLPLVDDYCPYSTPATPIVQFVYPIWKSICYAVYLILINVVWFADPKWLEPKNANEEPEGPEEPEVTVPMDVVTSQMLAWMIVNCEDSRSVDSALQAIAGARPNLPHAEIAQVGALELIDVRLKACTRRDPSTGRHLPRDSTQATAALKYCRSYAILMTGDGYTCGRDSWTSWYRGTNERRWTPGRNVDDIADIQMSLLDYAERACEDSSAFAAAASGPVIFSRWDWDRWYLADDAMALTTSFVQLMERVSDLLSQNVCKNDVFISDRSLICLLESCTHYMIGRWPKQQNRKQCRLSAALVYTFVQYRYSTPDIARIIAVMLAATAFTVNSYPSDDQELQDNENRERRAVKVLRYYELHRPDLEQIDDLFTFGLVGLLPYLNLGQISPPSSVEDELRNITEGVFSCSLVRPIPTLPRLYFWPTHCQASFQRLLRLINKFPDPSEGYSEQIGLYNRILPNSLGHVLCLPSIVSLRYARSRHLQDACISFLSKLPVAHCELDLDALFRPQDMLSALFKKSLDVDHHINRIAIFYFKLLIATVMLNSEHLLSIRQTTLKRVVNSCREFQRIRPSARANIVPSEDQILAHVMQETTCQTSSHNLLDTMQLVADFCFAETVRYDDQQVPGETNGNGSWAAKLQRIKDIFESHVLVIPSDAHRNLSDMSLC
ncbi:activating signal cointegrator 1 complex subunit 3 [Ceratobasidium sp. AG-Ba]|nr:activating signal cointegrator 1 complex subunit 3 [Ceratobasidium sp. AG-Ba]